MTPRDTAEPAKPEAQEPEHTKEPWVLVGPLHEGHPVAAMTSPKLTPEMKKAIEDAVRTIMRDGVDPSGALSATERSERKEAHEEAKARIQELESARWECGCGHVNGINLARCAVCTRDPAGRKPGEF